PGCGCGLRSRVVKIGAPAIPCRPVGFAQWRMTGADIRHLFGGAYGFVVDFPPTDPLGDEALVRVVDCSGVAAHRAVREDVEYMLGSHLLQHRRSRSLMRRVRAFVARRAIVEILRNSSALRLRTSDNRPDTNDQTDDKTNRTFHNCSS